MALARAFAPKKFAPQLPEIATPKSRAPAICAVVLALLTGLTAGQLVGLTRPDFGAQTVRPSGTAALLASAYYDAVNAYLSGKANSRLDDLIAADYRGHPGEDGIDERKDQYLARLTWLAHAFPLLRVQTELISSSPDLAVMQVTIEGTSGGAYDGIPIDVRPNPPAIEILRFDGDALAEQTSHVQWPGQYELLGSVQSTMTTGGVLQPRLERIELLAGGRLALGIGSAHLLLVESGALTVEGAGGPTRTPAYATGESNIQFVGAMPTPLNAGDLALAAGYGPFQIENAGSGPATLLLLRITSGVQNWNQGYPVFPASALSDSNSSRVALANGSEIESDIRSWKISMGRVTLTQGSTLSSHLIDGSETIVVETGALLVTGNGCESACVVTEKGTSQNAPGELLLQQSQGFSASRGATVSYEPVGSPATFLIVTISRPGTDRPAA